MKTFTVSGGIASALIFGWCVVTHPSSPLYLGDQFVPTAELARDPDGRSAAFNVDGSEFRGIHGTIDTFSLIYSYRTGFDTADSFWELLEPQARAAGWARADDFKGARRYRRTMAASSSSNFEEVRIAFSGGGHVVVGYSEIPRKYRQLSLNELPEFPVWSRFAAEIEK